MLAFLIFRLSSPLHCSFSNCSFHFYLQCVFTQCSDDWSLRTYLLHSLLGWNKWVYLILFYICAALLLLHYFFSFLKVLLYMCLFSTKHLLFIDLNVICSLLMCLIVMTKVIWIPFFYDIFLLLWYYQWFLFTAMYFYLHISTYLSDVTCDFFIDFLVCISVAM